MIWLPSIHESYRLRDVLTPRREPPHPDDEIVTAFRDGQVTLRSCRRTEGFTEAAQEVGYQRVQRGDLVVHAMDAFAGAIGVSDSTGKCSPVCQVLVPIPEVDARFIAYVLREGARSGYIQSLARGIRERSTDFRWSQAKDVWIPLPDARTQVAVVKFLDRECTRINATLTALTELLLHAEQGRAAQLEERLFALRSEWPLRKLAWDTNLLGGFAFKSEAFVHDPDAGVRLLRGTNVTPRGTRWDDVMYWPHERIHEATKFELHSGDLVVGLNRPWVRGGLRTAIIEDRDLPAFLLQRVGCIRPRPGVDLNMRYLQLWIQTSHFRTEVGDDAAVTFPMLEPDRVLGYRVPIPPVDKQAKLVDVAARMSAGLLALSSEIDKAISALADYRDALIVEAVTGQLDVVRLSDSEMAEGLDAVRSRNSPEVLA